MDENLGVYKILHGGMWPGQRKWWELPNFIRMFVGGYGVGKTLVLAKRMLTVALLNGVEMRKVSEGGKRWWNNYSPVGSPPPSAIVSPTYSVARETTLSTLESLLINLDLWYSYWRSRPDVEPRWIGHDIKRTAPYGVKIWYKRGRYKPRMGRIIIYSGENADKLKGPNIGAVGIDEPFIQPLEVFEQMIARCRHPKAKIREVNLTGCVVRDTFVWTRNGLIDIGDLDPGTQPKQFKNLGVDIYGRGGFHEATKFYNNGEDETVKLVATNGIELEATPDHPVLAMGVGGVPEFKRIGYRKGKYGDLGQLSVGDWVAVPRGMEVWGNQDPMLGTEHVMSNDAAYCLGAWIAEGSWNKSYSFTITCGDAGLTSPFLRGSLFGVPFRNKKRKDQIGKGSKHLTGLFQHLGMPLVKAPQKWIPKWVTAGKREWALHFLAGMYDGDGHVTATGQLNVGYTTTSKRMAQQLVCILLNLGIVARLIERETLPTEKVKVSSTSYQVLALGNQARKLASLLPLRIQRKISATKRYTGAYKDLEDLPNQGSLIAEAWSLRKSLRWRKRPKGPSRSTAVGTNSHEPNKIVERAKKGIQLSHSSVADFIKFWDANEGWYCKPIEALRKNIEEGYYWARVTSLTAARADTVDFVIPDTHTLITGQLLGLNTPEQLKPAPFGGHLN
jgi:intein/homing endonuclease